MYVSMCHRLTIHVVKDLWAISSFWLLHKALHLCIGFHLHISFYFSGKCPGVQLLGCMAIAYLESQNCQTFPKWLYYFIFLPVIHEWSNVSTSLLAFDVVTVFYFSYFVRCVMVVMMVLICIFLLTNGVEYLFMCLFSICNIL